MNYQREEDTSDEHACLCSHRLRLGAFAEFAVVREELVAKMPSSVDFTTAAGICPGSRRATPATTGITAI